MVNINCLRSGGKYYIRIIRESRVDFSDPVVKSTTPSIVCLTSLHTVNGEFTLPDNENVNFISKIQAKHAQARPKNRV